MQLVKDSKTLQTNSALCSFLIHFKLLSKNRLRQLEFTLSGSSQVGSQRISIENDNPLLYAVCNGKDIDQFNYSTKFTKLLV